VRSSGCGAECTSGRNMASVAGTCQAVIQMARLDVYSIAFLVIVSLEGCSLGGVYSALCSSNTAALMLYEQRGDTKTLHTGYARLLQHTIWRFTIVVVYLAVSIPRGGGCVTLLPEAPQGAACLCMMVLLLLKN
jgi:hypothetical protein